MREWGETLGKEIMTGRSLGIRVLGQKGIRLLRY